MVPQLVPNFPRVPDPSRRTQTRSSPPQPVPNLPDVYPNRPEPPQLSTDPFRTSLRIARPVPDLPDLFRTASSVSQPVPDLPNGFPTCLVPLLITPTRPEPPQGSPDPSLTSPKISRLILDLPEGPLTHPGPP